MKPRIVILALKDIRHNSRIERQAEALNDAGYEVEVLTILLNDTECLKHMNGYIIRRIQLDPCHGRLVRGINKSANIINRGIGRSMNAVLRGLGKGPQALAHILRGATSLNARRTQGGSPLEREVASSSSQQFSQQSHQETSQTDPYTRSTKTEASSDPHSKSNHTPAASTNNKHDSVDPSTKHSSRSTSSSITQASLGRYIKLPITAFVMGLLSLFRFGTQGLKCFVRGFANGLKWIIRTTTRGLTATVRFLTRPFWGFFRTLAFSRQAQQIYADTPAQIYQAHESKAMLAAYRLSRKHTAKFVCDVVDFAMDRITGSKKGILGHLGRQISQISHRFFLKRANVVITPTPILGDLITQYYGASSHVIMNCTWYKEETELSPPKTFSKKLEKSKISNIVFYSGMISEAHGMHLLCETISRLPKHYGLVLMGWIPDHFQDTLQEYFSEFGIRKRVILTPAVPPRQIPHYVSSAQVGVIATKPGSLNALAGLPNKFFEYLMARVPIAAPEVPSMKKIVQEERIGEVYSPGDVASLTMTLESICSPDKHIEYRENLKRAAARYSWETQAYKYTDLLMEHERENP